MWWVSALPAAFWRSYGEILTNYKGPPSKKCKTDEEVCQQKQEYDRTVRIWEFQPHWLKMFEWLEYHVTNGVGKMYCKICRKYERIETFITECRTFKIESIRSYNMSNRHVTIWTRMQMVIITTITRMITITVTTTVNNHSENLIWSCCSLNKCVLKSITFQFSCHLKF
jgi:hypothetical protein